MDFSQPVSPIRGLASRASRTSMRSKRSTSRLRDGARSAAATSTATPSRDSVDDSKTAVKVAIRVRPQLQPSDPGYDLIPQRLRASPCEVTSPTGLSVQSAHGKKLFVFDHVFAEDTTQEGVWQYLQESVQQFVQGYNVSILAYGQSGSGKSYTMGTTGPEEQSDASLRGIVPRAASALFDSLAAPLGPPSGLRTPQRYSTHGMPTLQSLNKIANAPVDTTVTDRDWQLKATYVEIYNEQLRDLLLPDSVPQAERTQVSIREDTKGRILLTGLTHVAVNSVEDILSALHLGSSIRQTDATAVNAKSSRSHAVFSLNLVRKKTVELAFPKDGKRDSVPSIESLTTSEGTVTTDCKLHFVDLAGSERLKNTGAQGDRAKEGISINAGLASLGRVISQLSTRQPGAHVSYRDSRLTRLLQDSLGGNAITYMIACITPVDFHLSETLNTVQYAQRARAIQSRPEIQQTTEDEDKAVRIERLQAEVAFLRDQVKLERSDVRPYSPGDKPVHREADLQNQLLDLHESYQALSQRHASLVSDMTQAQEADDSNPGLQTSADSKGRLQRSSSYAQTVEQVIAEYEKTIQNLESSLSNTRSNLSNKESVLMETETKIAYMETTTQQLETRLRKMSEREINHESYLRDLEAQLEGVSSSGEKSSTLVQSLRKELNRVKEGETSNEDYISTLEDRLAEAEQDQEIMQREIDRLEHVVERQRSIGKLDSLLADLGSNRVAEKEKHKSGAQTNGLGISSTDPFQDAVEVQPAVKGEALSVAKATSGVEQIEAMDSGDDARTGIAARSPLLVQEQRHAAQSNFMTDKLETVTQELFDLRLEHESTTTDYGELRQKYTIALQTLAKLKDSQEDVGSGDVANNQKPFFVDAGVNGLNGDGQSSASRSLSSRLSSQQPPATSTLTETPEVLSAEASDASQVPLPTAKESALSREIQALRKAHAAKEAESSQNFTKLQQRHQITLSQVEDLKLEVQKAQYTRAPMSPSLYRPMARRQVSQEMMASGSRPTMARHQTSQEFMSSGSKPMVARRQTSQEMMSFASADRANRSFASLRNIGLDNLEAEPEIKRDFEMHLNTVMSELHSQREKGQVLESEVAVVRRDLEAKSAMISGLTKERATLSTASTVEFSVVEQMQAQLLKSEERIREMQQSHAGRERESNIQMQALRSKADDAAQAAAGAKTHQAEVTRLQRQHGSAMESMKASESRLLETIAGLEAFIQAANTTTEHSVAGSQLFSKTTSEILPPPGAAEEVDPMDAYFTTRGRDISLDISPRTPGALLPSVKRGLDASMQAVSMQAANPTTKHRIAGLQVSSDTPSRLFSSTGAAEEVDPTDAHFATGGRDPSLDISPRTPDALLPSANRKFSQSPSVSPRGGAVGGVTIEQERASHVQHVASLQQEIRSLEGQLRDHQTVMTTHQQGLEVMRASHAAEVDELRRKMNFIAKEYDERQGAMDKRHYGDFQELESELKKVQIEMIMLVAGAGTALGIKTDAATLPARIKEFADSKNMLETKQLQHASDVKALQAQVQTTQAKNSMLENKLGELKMMHEEATLNLEKVTSKEHRSARLVQELEDQLNSTFDQQKVTANRLSTMHGEKQLQLDEAWHAKTELEKEMEDYRLRVTLLESQLAEVKRRSHNSAVPRDSYAWNRDSLSPEAAAHALARPISASSLRKSASQAGLPSPPPVVPLPPLPNSSLSRSPLLGSPPTSPINTQESALPDPAMAQLIREQETKIRTVEKHLYAEKQLTATLEEALQELETSQNRARAQLDSWKHKCAMLEDELSGMRRELDVSQASLPAADDERAARLRAEKARNALEERMRQLGAGQKKKKKNPLNCF